MSLGNSVMQRRKALDIRWVQGAEVPQQQIHHRRGSYGGSTVDWILPSLVADACGSFVLNEEAGGVEVLFGRDEVKGCLMAVLVLRSLQNRQGNYSATVVYKGCQLYET